MKRLLIVLFSMLFVAFIACNNSSDDDDSSTPTSPTETTETDGTEGDDGGGGDGTEEEAPPPEDPAPIGVLLDQGVDSASEGVATLLATITMPGPGTVTVTVVWEGDPGEMVIYFKHGGPANHGWAKGPSPLMSSFPVPAGEEGGGWNFYIANTEGPTNNVAWEVRFIAD